MVSDGICSSLPSSNAVINIQPSVPSAPIIGTITQPTCTFSAGSVDLSGLPAIGSWTATATPGGSTISGTGPITTGAFIGLTANTYTFTVLSVSGCTSVASTSALINVQPATPASPIVGTITQPTCTVSTGSVALSMLPIFGDWIVTASPSGATIISPLGSVLTIGDFNNLATGSYTFTATNSSGCTSLPSAVAIIDSQPLIPATPILGVVTQPTCAIPSGSIELTGLPATGVWIVSANPSGQIISGSSPVTSTQFVGLSPAIYTFTVTNSDGCISTSTTSSVINSIPSSPISQSFVSVIEPTCDNSTGSVNFILQPGFEYSVGGQYQLDNFFTGLDASTYTLSVMNLLDVTCYFDTVISFVIKECEIEIPTAFTPDFDNVNDSWELHNIDKIFPNNVVSIYNRWGSLIFESPKGKYESNSWNGTYNGKELPVESYYFIIEYNDESKRESGKGTVTIILK